MLTKYFRLLKSDTIWLPLVLIIVFASCRSASDITYLKDVKSITSVVPRSVLDYRYKIKVNDNLYVSIVSPNQELNQIYNPATIGTTNSGGNSNLWTTLSSQFVHGYIVDLDGSITLPTIGKVHVLGLTIPECEIEIQAKANQFLKDVTAKVRLLNHKVTVLGEVFNPGVYYNYNTEFTIFDALSMAGGVRNTAALSHVLVLREIGNKTQTFRLDLNSVNSLVSESYNILPNDVVIVQPAKNKNLELQVPVFSLIFSSITTVLLVINFFTNSNN